MNDKKINVQLQQQIDACRAADITDEGNPTVSLPGLELLAGALAAEQNRGDAPAPLADELRQSAAFDRGMAAAFRDVQPPSGLADRLLAGVLEDAESADVVEDETSSGNAVVARAVEATPAGPIIAPANRRGVLITLGCAIAAAAALVLVALLPAPELSRDEFMVLVDEHWVQQSLERDSESWQEIADTAALENRSPSNMVRARAAHWRTFSSNLDPAGVEYDLRATGTSRQAILYVVRTRTVIEGLPTVPSRRPQIMTGGWVISSWREGDLVYVLAVQGDSARYRQMIRMPQFS